MIRSFSNPFNGINGFNVVDGPMATNTTGLPVGVGCGWTQGAGLVQQVTGFVTTITQKAAILSFGVSAQISLLQLLGGNPYGKLGKILAGIGGPPVAATTSAVSGSISPMPALPPDPSLTTPLFDPANDPLPPFVTSDYPPPAIMAPASCGVVLPQPIRISNYSSLNVGLYINPSLITVGNPVTDALAPLQIYNAYYTITYDDGVVNNANPNLAPA